MHVLDVIPAGYLTAGAFACADSMRTHLDRFVSTLPALSPAEPAQGYAPRREQQIWISGIEGNLTPEKRCSRHVPEGEHRPAGHIVPLVPGGVTQITQPHIYLKSPGET